MLEILFYISIFIIVYTYVGYGVLLLFLVKIKQQFVKPFIFKNDVDLPTVTLLIAAFNEESIIEAKIEDCLKLNYPQEKLKIIFITDGCSDQTPILVAKNNKVELMHQDVRAGKMAAIKRAIPQINSEIIVFTDANTFLNQDAILQLVKHYQKANVGAVAGEKRIMVDAAADASAAGEGFYWKYESALKKMDYELYSNVGAAGELFSIRTNLYQPVETDTIIDDHMIAMRIAEKGYIIAYEPNAYALEGASENSKEELKRKIRIAAGGIQSILRLKKAANPFHNFTLTFQYISHRVLRWAITPWVMILAFFLNILVCFNIPENNFLSLILLAQCTFYFSSFLGFLLESKKIKIKMFFIPYYFSLMNYAAMAGAIRYFKGKQSAAWEKSKRR